MRKINKYFFGRIDAPNMLCITGSGKEETGPFTWQCDMFELSSCAINELSRVCYISYGGQNSSESLGEDNRIYHYIDKTEIKTYN